MMDLSTIMYKLIEYTDEAVENFKTTMEDLDREGFNNPAVTIKARMAMDQYSNFLNYQSSIVKNFRDLMAGIISKV